jgi:hypothetical protein
MAGKNTDGFKLNTLIVQVLAIKIAVLSIPVYLLFLSPTCGIFALYLSQNYSLLTTSLFVLLPALFFAGRGVLRESNRSFGISSAITALPIIANTSVEPYSTVIDFVLLLLYLEVSTALTSFSNIAHSIKSGEEESVSYNYRLALGHYVGREMAIVAVTLLVSLGAVFLTMNLNIPIGIPGAALLATITLLVTFATLASRYREQ